MAFMTVKLVPGVHAEQTPLLLQAGVIQSNNVRWKDGLPEKIGGWKKFYPSALVGPVRELWTWGDLNGANHLAAAGGDTVTVITNNAPQIVTPLTALRYPTAINVTTGSSEAVITDVGSNATTFESITVQTPIAFVGLGVLRPGNYPIIHVIDNDHYAISIGGPSPVTVGGTLCTITSASGLASFTVHLSGSTGAPPPLLAVGSNFSIVLPTTVGGVVLNGFYKVASVIDANNFTIMAPNQASSTQTVNYGNVAAPGIQLIQWVTGSPPPIVATLTATAAFAAGYYGIAMPPNPGTVLPGMTVVNRTTGSTLGTVASYGPLSTSQYPTGHFTAGQTSIGMYPYTSYPGIIPGMSISDTSAGGSALGTVASYLGNTLTLAAGAPFAAHNTLLATRPFTYQYKAISMPPNPGYITAGMTVTDINLGGVLGTVASYGPYTTNAQVSSAGYLAGATSIPLRSPTFGDIIPGMTVFNSSVSGTTPLGTVASCVGSVLTLTAGAPFHSITTNDNLFFTSGSNHVLVLTASIIFAASYGANDVLSFFGTTDQLAFTSGTNHVLVLNALLTSGSAGPNDVLDFLGSSSPTLTALAAFTTDYAGIYMPPNPGFVTTGMTVLDQTTGVILGTVRSYRTGQQGEDSASLGWPPGATTIQMHEEGWRNALPGMTISQNGGPPTFGTVASFLGFNLVLTGPAPSPGGTSDVLYFRSDTQNVLFITPPGPIFGPLHSASAGANDVLAFLVSPHPPPAGSVPLSADDWCMFNFGSILLINPEDGPIFQYDPTSGLPNAQLVPNAPLAHGMFLAMPEQMVVAYGASVQGVQDPMLVAWSDAADFNTWILGVQNQAGSYRLSRGSKIVGGIQAPMQAMLWTDVGLWLMTYIGYPDVWGFSEIAQECGLIAKKAVGVLGSQVFWMGKDKFWTFSGGQVQPVPCEVWDAVFQNLNHDLVDLIRCGTDTAFDGIGWFYPSLATKLPGAIQENDSFVKFNRVTGEWDYGTPIDVYGDGKIGGSMISDWIDANVFGNPISAMTNSTGTQSQLMWMDMGQDAVDQPIHWWIRTGLFVLSEGEDFIFIDRCRPDFKWRKFSSPTTPSAQIQFTLYAQDDSDNPLKPPSVYGPYTVTNSSVIYPGGLVSAGSNAFDPRARGRYFSMKVEGDDLGSFARLGAMKFQFSPDGRAG